MNIKVTGLDSGGVKLFEAEETVDPDNTLQDIKNDVLRENPHVTQIVICLT